MAPLLDPYGPEMNSAFRSLQKWGDLDEPRWKVQQDIEKDKKKSKKSKKKKPKKMGKGRSLAL